MCLPAPGMTAADVVSVVRRLFTLVMLLSDFKN